MLFEPTAVVEGEGYREKVGWVSVSPKLSLCYSPKKLDQFVELPEQSRDALPSNQRNEFPEFGSNSANIVLEIK